MAQVAIDIHDFIPDPAEVLEQHYSGPPKEGLEAVKQHGEALAALSKTYAEGCNRLVKHIQKSTVPKEEISKIVAQLRGEEIRSQKDFLPQIDAFEDRETDFLKDERNYRKAGAREFSKLAKAAADECRKSAESYRRMLEAIRDCRIAIAHASATRADINQIGTEVKSAQDIDDLFSAWSL